MNGILIAVLIVTGLLIYKIISSSRKQEGYKRWKAGNRGNTEDITDTEATRKGWFSRYFGASAPITIPWFDEEAVAKCANLLGVKEEVLKEILKDISGHYREFWIGKRKGGYRMISAPDKELKAIQDTINHRVLSFVNIHPAATGFRCKMSISDNVRPHLGKPYVLKTDIHDFFGSVRSPRIRKMFEDMGYPPKIARVLAALCCVHRCLPQGASTSPALSNIISYEMDKKLAALATEYNLVYTRYADDLTFSGCLLYTSDAADEL